jgi:hypothetical protein
VKQRKIFYALSKLDLVDLNQFKKFVHSPYFNVNEHMISLFEILEKGIRDGMEINDLANEDIWLLLHPDLAYDHGRLLKHYTDLMYLLENYFAQREYDENLSAKANDKLAGARKRGQDKLFPKLIGELERLDRQDFNQSGDYYYKKYKIERSIFDLINDNERKNSKVEVETSIDITKISDNLDYFYIIEKLRLYCTVLSWKKMYKLNIDVSHMETVELWASEYKNQSIPAIRLYQNIKSTYLINDDIYYYKLREIMRDYMHIFPQDEVKEIYSTALNYCISKANKGLFEDELFELYKEGIDRGILINNNLIAPTMFRNIVFSALKVGDSKWAQNFIEENQKYLESRFRNNAVNFSKARVEFHHKNYGNTLNILNQVSYEDVWYNLGTRTLQIACFYELREEDVLESLLISFQTYLKREKTLTKERKLTYQNLIKFSRDLIKVDPKNKKKILQIKAKLSEEKNVTSKSWLMEKVDELLSKLKK